MGNYVNHIKIWDSCDNSDIIGTKMAAHSASPYNCIKERPL